MCFLLYTSGDAVGTNESEGTAAVAVAAGETG